MRRIFLTACAAALAIAACQKSPTPVVQTSPPQTSAPIPATPETATAVAPEDPLALPGDGKRNVDHLARAKQLQNDGDLPGALLEARRAISENPSDEEALTLISRVGRRAHARDLAAIAYGRIAALHGEDATPLVQQARLLVEMGKADEALVVARRASERDAQSPEVFQVMGRAYFAKDDLSNAIVQFERVVELDPEHGYALNNLGLAYLHANENEKAVMVLKHAAELLPQIAYVINNYGVALERTGDVDEARVAYAQATDLSPKYVKALLNAQRLKKVAKAGTPEVDTQGIDEEPSEDAVPVDPEL